MDPNEALRVARQCAKTLLETGPGADPAAVHNIADELAEKFAALDEWITKGGFLPKGWEGPLTMTAAGNWTDNERVIRRLATVFDRVIRDDEVLDRSLSTEKVSVYASSQRERVIQLLAREVIEEANRERAKIEEMINSQVTRTFIRNAAETALKKPATWVLVDPDADLPGFTPEGMRLIREARERNAAENDR